jgi:phospholipase/carboxylesterase
VRYGGVGVLSGGLIGKTLGGYEGELGGTPVFLGCSDVDPHIPEERVHDTRDIFESLGADVEERIYGGMGHGINEDEIEYLRSVVAEL